MDTSYTAELVESYVDALDLLEMLDNKIYKLTGATKAKGPEHFWEKDAVRASKTPAAAAKAEGRQFVGKAGTDPTRLWNTTQFFMEDVKVTGTNQRSTHIAIKDKFAAQSAKEETALAKDIERTLIYGVRGTGTFAAGVETVVRSAAGIKELIKRDCATNHVATAGAFDEDLFKALVQKTWENGERSADLEVFTDPKAKNAVSLFTTPNQRNIEAKAKMIVLPVDSVATDFGIVNFHLHREVASGDMLGLDKETFKKAMMMAPKTEQFAKRGDSIDGAVMAEMTFELHKPGNSFFATGLTFA